MMMTFSLFTHHESRILLHQPKELNKFLLEDSISPKAILNEEATSIFFFLLSNGCIFPEGWRYFFDMSSEWFTFNNHTVHTVHDTVLYQFVPHYLTRSDTTQEDPRKSNQKKSSAPHHTTPHHTTPI